MLNRVIPKIALFALFASCISAAPINPVHLGWIEFQKEGDGLAFNRFRLINWTGGVVPGYGLTTAVDFEQISLRIDYEMGGSTFVNEEVWSTPSSVAPSINAYSVTVLAAKNITQAVLRAKLSSFSFWTLDNGGGTHDPADPRIDAAGNFEMILAPEFGAYLAPSTDSWNIDPNMSIPEPMSIALAGAGLISIALFRRRRV